MIRYILFLVMLFANEVNSQVMFGETDSKKVLNFNSNYLTFSEPVEVFIRGKLRASNPGPETLNGEKIYRSEDKSLDKRPLFSDGYGDLSDYLYQILKKHFEKLPEGQYRLRTFNLVVNKDGKLVYFDFGKMQWSPLAAEIRTFKNSVSSSDENSREASSFQNVLQDMIHAEGLDSAVKNPPPQPYISEKAEKTIYLVLYKALKNCPRFKPAVKNGSPVNCVLFPPKYGFTDLIIVKDHQTSLLRVFNR